MLKKVVDWCGCSPLVFTAMDTFKYAVETAKKKTVFFGRKFDSFISQSAIAQAESQAFRNMAPNLVDPRHASFERVWINFYNRIVDKSRWFIESFTTLL
ncbi:unnamed protein product [Anisakis simplex]|uniref:Xylosyltransferase sqv-6 (inferred by orthology to a C. elegans protein) n=1 Tax=Anisakis simplex TaxID=6269 RepID=A0A0M3JJU8_ANISI|nr:unnamed protein product [Anisakis simplex]